MVYAYAKQSLTLESGVYFSHAWLWILKAFIHRFVYS